MFYLYTNYGTILHIGRKSLHEKYWKPKKIVVYNNGGGFVVVSRKTNSFQNKIIKKSGGVKRNGVRFVGVHTVFYILVYFSLSS